MNNAKPSTSSSSSSSTSSSKPSTSSSTNKKNKLDNFYSSSKPSTSSSSSTNKKTKLDNSYSSSKPSTSSGSKPGMLSSSSSSSGMSSYQKEVQHKLFAGGSSIYHNKELFPPPKSRQTGFLPITGTVYTSMAAIDLVRSDREKMRKMMNPNLCDKCKK